jgi:hypothetical protein
MFCCKGLVIKSREATEVSPEKAFRLGWLGVSRSMPHFAVSFFQHRYWLLGCIVAVASHSAAQAPQVLTALQSLQSGLWEFRSKEDPSANRSLCLSDPKVILQLRHFGQNCSRFVIKNDPRLTVVHYTCALAGQGQTSVRVETPRLVQLESQGVAGHSPFSFTAEGRRVGECQAR